MGPTGREVITRVLGGGSHQELRFTGDSAGCHLGHTLEGGLLSVQGPAGSGPHRTDAEAVIVYSV